ncbi:MAG: DNA starvation/stationary phase protection protein Dps [Puniceicoccales bacterium]|jgi:starvation-inducible DNA-binding protein|nr:DNA starvation/stationary phase protection protein Dps [Puniceicoccales bacterium]
MLVIRRNAFCMAGVMAKKISKPETKKSTLAPTLNDLPVETRELSTALLNQALADLSDLHSQAKQAHWNVYGANFFSQHELFDKLADILFEPLDEIAERVVSLGGVAAGTVRQAAAASSVPEFPTDAKGSLAYITALAEHVAVAAKSVRAAIATTADAGDADTSDLLTGVSRSLDKTLWFLEAHTRE